MSNKRNEQIDRVLTAFYRGEDRGASAECLDAETLAAWMDETLAGPVLARAETHVAVCARCQSVLAAIARTADAATGVQAGGAPVRSRFWRVLPWAAPLATAATAAIVYVAVQPERARSPEADQFRTSVARGETQAQSGASALPPSAPSADAAGAAATPAEPLTASATRRDAPVENPAPQQKAENRPLAGGDSRRSESQLAKASPPPPLPQTQDLKRELEDVAKPAAPPAPPPPPAAAPLAETVGTPAEAQPKSRASSASAYGQRPAARAKEAAAAEGVPLSAFISIATPDPAIRWRAANNLVQLSRDGGATWATQRTAVSMALTAGSAPSPTVCWMVGRAGTIIRTTDAMTWQSVEFPEQVDLASVTAASPDAATVTTADGRTFVTVDGGKTWKAVVRSP